MNVVIRTRLAGLGAALSPEMIQATAKLMASLQPARDPAVEIARDLRYGPDERNRLDVFRKGSPLDAPVLVYVHGGGFVMGDKTAPGSPFFDNFGQWAAQQGWVGVTMTYRLAPTHRWPSGPEDVASAVSWLRANIAAHGGSPRQIFLVGQSAGGAHVAAYIAHQRFHIGDVGVAGAVLISALLDLSLQPVNPYSTACFGGDMVRAAEAASIAGLVASPVPLLFTASEFDPRDFQDQAMQLAQAWHQQKGCLAPIVFLYGHNHISPAQTIGTKEDQLARCIQDFVAAVSLP